MRSELWRYRTAAVAAGICLLAGCKGREAGTTSGAADTSAMKQSAAATDSVKKTDESALTDPNIVALLDEANKADSAAGAYAASRATTPQVKAFARMMMSEHHALRLAGQQLAKKLSVTPQPPANDPLPAAAQAETSALKSAPKGAGFDRTYIDQEVGIHKAVLDLANKGHDATQTPELKALIEQAKPVIEKHLNTAEELQKKLGSPTT